jgi:hypothetical protein
MSKYDSWLESNCHDNDDEVEQLDVRVAELLKGEYYPYSADNIQEALGEHCLEKSMNSLITACENNDKATIGLLVKSSIYTYWEIMANNRASNEYNQGLLN